MEDVPDRGICMVIRNDLAVTFHKLGDCRACYAILEPYAEDAALKDDDIDGYYGVVDRYVYLSTVSAARVNLRLCERAKEAVRQKNKH